MSDPSETDVAALRDLIVEVRRTFRALAGLSDRMLEDRGLTASLRAVLEFLTEEGPSPVPKIAGAKAMTRQSMQALVDRLEKLGLVESLPNPEHKRSVLIALTDKGRDLFQAIHEEEGKLLRRISRDWSDGRLRETCRTLRAFQARLNNLEGKTDAEELASN